MKIVDKNLFKELYKTNHPLKSSLSHIAYNDGIKNLLNEHGFEVENTIGFEIGCGVGRSIFKLATSFKMEAIEASKILSYHKLTSSFYLHPYDFLEHDLSFLKEKYDFIIIDNLNVEESELKKFEKQLKLIAKDKCLILFSGTKEELKIIRSIVGLELHVEHNDLLDVYFDNKDYDYQKENFTVLALGYDSYNPVMKDPFENDEDEETVEEKLDNGQCVKLDAKEIRKANKEELKIFYQAFNMEFDETAKLKTLRENLIKERGL